MLLLFTLKNPTSDLHRGHVPVIRCKDSKKNVNLLLFTEKKRLSQYQYQLYQLKKWGTHFLTLLHNLLIYK